MLHISAALSESYRDIIIQTEYILCILAVSCLTAAQVSTVPFTFTCHIVCPFVKHSFHYSPSRNPGEKHFKAALTELAPGSCLFAPFTG